MRCPDHNNPAMVAPVEAVSTCGVPLEDLRVSAWALDADTPRMVVTDGYRAKE